MNNEVKYFEKLSDKKKKKKKRKRKNLGILFYPLDKAEKGGIGVVGEQEQIDWMGGRDMKTELI